MTKQNTSRPARLMPLLVAFAGGRSGPWRIERIEGVSGEGDQQRHEPGRPGGVLLCHPCSPCRVRLHAAGGLPLAVGGQVRM